MNLPALEVVGQTIATVVIGCLIALPIIKRWLNQMTEKVKPTEINGHLKAYMNVVEGVTWIKLVKHLDDGRVIFQFQSCNEAFERAFGVRQSSYKGHEDKDFFPKDVADAWYASDSACYSNRGTVSTEEEIPVLGKPGETELWLVEKTYIESHGLEGIIGVMKKLPK